MFAMSEPARGLRAARVVALFASDDGAIRDVELALGSIERSGKIPSERCLYRPNIAKLAVSLQRAGDRLAGEVLSPSDASLLASAARMTQPPTNAAGVLLVDHTLGETLRIWERACGDRVDAILAVDVLANSIERSARTLGVSDAVAMALLEANLRLIITALGDHRVLVLDTTTVAEQLDLLDEGLASLLDHASRSDQYATPIPPEVPVGCAELIAWLQANTGLHECFTPPNLCAPDPLIAEIATLFRALGTASRALSWSAEQIETLLRALANTTPVASTTSEDDAEVTEPTEDGPYPPNASEDRRAYHRWLSSRRAPVVLGGMNDAPRRTPETRPGRRTSRSPLISVLVPVWRTPRWALERCVGSVLAQDFADWELCICDDGSGEPDLTDYLASLCRLDRRIHVTALGTSEGISNATNAALALARGRYVAFLDHDDELAPCALSTVARAIEANEGVDVLYSDEDKIDERGERFDPLFKPDWSPDLLLSFAYLCHLTVIQRQLVEDLGGLRSEFDGSQDYDLSLRATERADSIVHIPEILYHWRALAGSAASDTTTSVAKPWAYEAGRLAIADALARRGEAGEVTSLEHFPGRYHVRRAIAARPRVSVIIPFRDEPALLATCATSLRNDPGYDNFELVLVDNGSELPETQALLDRLSTQPNVRVIEAPGPFNWATINNDAARTTTGDLLLFMNNDIEARKPGWLDALVGHAQRPEVGAVGARLVYPDGAIQHAGVVIGLGGIAGHVLRGLPADHAGYNSMAIQTRNCSVVTGAAMMTRRDLFEAVGGFDKHLPVAFNDVDYCLKLREQGYLVVYTPLAELVHHESRSRGHTDDLDESKRILSRWADTIAAGDSYMNVHLSHWRYWCPLSTAQEDFRWKNYLETSVLTRGESSST